MLPPTFDAFDESDPERLLEALYADLVAILEGLDVERAASETGLEVAVLRALREGNRPPLTLVDAAAVIAAGAEDLDPEEVEGALRERLLMGMSMAVLDVEAIEARSDLDYDGKEIQQKVEGRAPMSLEEYAHVVAIIADHR